MRRRNKAQVPSADSDSSPEASDDSSDTANSVPSPKRKRGRPPAPKNKKKQKLQDDSDDDITSQPSTSHNADNRNEESESDSGSETLDSDYENVIDRSLVKSKTLQKKRGRPSKAPAKQKKPQDDGKSSQKHNLNSTNKKISRVSTSNGIVYDPKSIDALAQKCVYFLLIEDQKKYAIKRKAIITHVFKDEDYSAKLYVAVINKANMILKKTYGMELMELENQKDGYIIINILGRELGIHEYVELSRLKQQQHGLILYLVTVIYMNDNVITEDELTKSLKPLGIDLASKRLHPVFGDVKKYITTELVKQMYLNYQCVSKEPPRYEITWGLRAKQEFGKMDLLQFACQIMDDTSPEDWKIQYKDAEKSAKPNSE